MTTGFVPLSGIKTATSLQRKHRILTTALLWSLYPNFRNKLKERWASSVRILEWRMFWGLRRWVAKSRILFMSKTKCTSSFHCWHSWLHVNLEQISFCIIILQFRVISWWGKSQLVASKNKIPGVLIEDKKKKDHSIDFMNLTKTNSKELTYFIIWVS